jgi:hypothetical protein
MDGDRQHWEHIYETKDETRMSWYQARPGTSLALIDSCHLPFNAAILDVGGGDSRLAEALLDKGFNNIWVLDISAKALHRARTRLGERAELIHWIESDILGFIPPVTFELWHDRAAFHFLTTEDAISRYAAMAYKSIAENGNLIMATFSDKGPEKCSGLEVRRYSQQSLSGIFSPYFEKTVCMTEDHLTPFDSVQKFLFCKFKKASPEKA